MSAEKPFVIDGGGASIKDHPAYQMDYMCLGGGDSMSMLVFFVDFTKNLPDVKCSYSKSDTLIKYSEARFSPVSSHPVDCIQLALPSYYRQFNEGQNSELIADDKEGIYIERSYGWDKPGSSHMERSKKKIAEDYGHVNNGHVNNLDVEIKYDINDRWLYCVSVDPCTNDKRMEQMKEVSPRYDYMMVIEEPSKFALQLGLDFAQQIDFKRDGGTIVVTHGPVIYSDVEIPRFPNDEVWGGDVALFIKRNRYKGQQEYRFTLKVASYTPKEDVLYLKVSEELRNLYV